MHRGAALSVWEGIAIQPDHALLGFAAWTLTLLIGTVGYSLWGRILTGRQRIGEFGAGEPSGAAWYGRATRAHANCVETFLCSGAIVVVLRASGVAGPGIDALRAVVLCSRIGQSVVHVTFDQTDRFAAIRFLFFLLQILGMSGLMLVAASSWRLQGRRSLASPLGNSVRSPRRQAVGGTPNSRRNARLKAVSLS